MEPIPETVAAIEELEDGPREDGLLKQLRGMAERVQAVAPECVGFSLSVLEHGVTFTLVATSDEIRRLDAAQYVDDGPCLRAVDVAEVLETDHGRMDEEGWQLFSLATAARGVASTLSMPIIQQGRVTGGVNLYGSSPDAFRQRHDDLADVLGTWAHGAVTNADLSFDTLRAAQQAPAVLRDSTLVDAALGALVATRGYGIDEAQERLRQAAAQAGIPEKQVARLVLDVLARPSDD